MEKARKIPVLEVFGPTIQGEGMVIGQKTMFVRTAGCDYQCSWCDSAFTWDGSAKDEIKQMTAEEIWNELKEIGDNRFNHVTISGGNPALLSSIGSLINLLHEKGIEVAVETQGSIWKNWFLDIDQLTLSPKPPSSGMETNFEKLDEIFHRLKQNSNFGKEVSLKVVVFDEEDFQYARDVHTRYPEVSFFLQVGNSDIEHEASTKDLLEKLEWLVNKVVESPEMNHARVLPQLHTLIWGNKRGV
ncbi:7-carboxy-7-deazaguanine synthase QueE [Lottiidibacillus patelloidae]|uniref:7-carboxy-7-deazaguanine synthase n=1 Tax=Lottiidibacillus patelloidae TaxID=2670334 RepID=A0A263BYA8_9BACI|nr:7-carboxy-7-deazaguanine synthase QueE [Lottiidibacillus patelloidae]OZM58297.1 7-carboxy-7-deazaguanine synthase QueE [Lottiidibacillus patelloidae]